MGLREWCVKCKAVAKGTNRGECICLLVGSVDSLFGNRRDVPKKYKKYKEGVTQKHATVGGLDNSDIEDSDERPNYPKSTKPFTLPQLPANLQRDSSRSNDVRS
jgi:hypothetical protein